MSLIKQSNKLRSVESDLLGNLLRKGALILLRSYQIVGSPIFGGACRFYPTCSCYGMEAFKMYDTKKAFLLTLKRILKCRPLGPSGFDPVPSKEAINE